MEAKRLRVTFFNLQSPFAVDVIPEVCLQERFQGVKQKDPRIGVDLLHEGVLLGVAAGLPGLIRAIAQHAPVEYEVDIFGEALDESKRFRETGTALEGERVSVCAAGKQVVERPADPEVLLHDGRGQTRLRSRLGEQFDSLFGGRHRDLMHGRAFRSVSSQTHGSRP